MAFSVTQFAAQGLPFGGARPSLFEVDIQTPAGVDDVADVMRFVVQGAQIPAATVASIDVPYFGRQVKVAGNRTFADWTPTILNDEDFRVRNAMEQWSNKINSFQSNLREGTNLLGEYRTLANVTQFSKTGAKLRTYRFVNIFPTEVSTIDLSWETDAIETFTVNFVYDYWEVTDSSNGLNLNVNFSF